MDSSKIFRSLLEVKQLESWTNEEWSFNNDHLTNEQENYLNFYSNFKKWYDELYQSLISKNKAYKGMAYRIASCMKSPSINASIAKPMTERSSTDLFLMFSKAAI